MTFEELIEKLTPEIYMNMKQSLELGKWPDGRKMTADQKETTMQALIAWEIKHEVPEDQRIAYIERDECSSKSAFEPVKFIDK